MGRFVLASGSPRRIEMLKNLKVDFEVIPSDFNEVITEGSPYDLVCEFALHKAKDVEKKVDADKIIIAADTIVYKDGMILGKPKSKDDAFEMLSKLSGSCHKVITGLCLIDRKTGKICKDYEETKVFFKQLSRDEIERYINTGEPLDKAGAYGIQGFGGLFVKKIEGCYFNVVGLPIHKLYLILGRMGVNLLTGEE